MEASLGSSTAHSAALLRSSGTQALVMVVGQHEPDSIWACMYSEGPKADQAEGRASNMGRLALPLRRAMAIIMCQAG